MTSSSEKLTYLPDESLDTAGTTISLVEGDLTNDCVAMVPAKLHLVILALIGFVPLVGDDIVYGEKNILAELLHLLDLGREVVGKGVLERLSEMD